MLNCVVVDIFLMSILANDIDMTISDHPVFEGPLRQLARSAWQLLLFIGVTAVASVSLCWSGQARHC